MENLYVSLAEAKTHLSELTERAASGETVVITKHGKPIGRLVKAEAPRQPVNREALRALTESMPWQEEDAGRFMRDVRDGARY